MKRDGAWLMGKKENKIRFSPKGLFAFTYRNDLLVNHLKFSPADRIIIFHKLPRLHSFLLHFPVRYILRQKNKTKPPNKQTNKKQHKTLLRWILERLWQEDHSKSVFLLGLGPHEIVSDVRIDWAPGVGLDFKFIAEDLSAWSWGLFSFLSVSCLGVTSSLAV